MRIAKALKLKNRIAGVIAKLKETIKSNNSLNASYEQVYDVAKLAKETLPQRIRELVLIKTVIACANAGVSYSDPKEYEGTAYWAIFSMAELKGMIEMLRETETKHGSFDEGRSYGLPEPKPTVYAAALKQVDVDLMVLEMEQAIDVMQDFLDAQNATVKADILDAIKI